MTKEKFINMLKFVGEVAIEGVAILTFSSCSEFYGCAYE